MTDEAAAPLPTGEQAELERLRAQVAELHREVERPAARSRRHAGWWRTLVATVCIVVAGVLAPLAIVSVWAKAEVTDTERYVQTMAPLASDPSVQSAATNAVTDAIVQKLDIQGLTDQAFSQLGTKGVLPQSLADALKNLSTPVANGITDFIHSTVAAFVSSPQFADAWEAANRSAHQQMVDTLSGSGQGAVTISNGEVSVQLATVINSVKQILADKGFDLAAKIPDVDATFTIFSDPNVDKLQTAYRLLETAGWLLPIVCLVLFAVGVWVAKSHRRAVVGAAVTAFLAAALLSIGLALLRHGYLDAVASDMRDAAAAIFDQITRFLRDGIRNVAIVGLAVAIGAFLLGPSVTAVRSRQLMATGIGRLRTGLKRLGLHLARVTGWVAPNARWLRVASVLLVVVVYALWQYRTPAVTLWVIAALLALLFVIQLLASPSPALAGPALPATDRGATGGTGTPAGATPGGPPGGHQPPSA